MFGAQAPPSLIDLAMDPGTVLHGSVAGGILGNGPTAGDVNGDGFADIVVEASQATNKQGTTLNSGRVHVIFGRPTWPPTLDLLTQGDVTVFGDGNQSLGRALAVGDIDGDGQADILVTAPGGDGPAGTRPSAGDIFVLRGRNVWPAQIDLAVGSADAVIHGADTEDRFGGSAQSVTVCDLDGDGLAELAVGADDADGRDNLQNAIGEVRLYEPGGLLPPEVDLLTETETVILGADVGDGAGLSLFTADVDGDGSRDLATAAQFADGPGETRADAGEVFVFYGRDPFPAELDLALGDEDVIVYGALAGDRTGVRATSDVNGDGVAEVVVATNEGLQTRVPTLWLVSPVDTDGDGLTNLPDNCPRVANADQTDGDADLVGDVCDNCAGTPNADQRDGDGDGIGDACDACPGTPGVDDSDPDLDGVDNCTDNCPGTQNAAQLDGDGDGTGDACDPCPADPGVDAGDPDGDGVSNCSDNCPGAPNPVQGDGDGDGRGDLCDPCPATALDDGDGDGACEDADNCPGEFNAAQADTDGDGVGDLCDVCPAAPDAAQSDGDGDGAGDACDCQPNDPNDRVPAEVDPLTVRETASGTLLSWHAAAGGDVYRVTRGTLSGLGAGSYGACLADGLLVGKLEDAALPPAGDGFFYLVAAESFDCGPGSLGRTSAEQPRSNGDPGACAGAPHVDAYPTGEVTQFGTRSGSYLDVQASDDVRETITEVLGGPGLPPNWFSRLEHRWIVPVTPGRRVELHLEGFRSSSSDGDDFVFEYATDLVNYKRILVQLPLSDEDTDLVGLLPASLSGNVNIRVTDTDRTPGRQALDTISIDELFVRSIP